MKLTLKYYLFKGLTTKALIVGLLAFTLIWWVGMFLANQEVENIETSVDGVINYIETSWTEIENQTGIIYVPQAKVFFVEPQDDVQLRAVFVTDFE